MSELARVAELVDALASGVSVLTDVGVQVPPFAPNQTTTNEIRQQKITVPARVAELVDALASGVSVLTDVRVQVPPFAPICSFFASVFSLIFPPKQRQKQPNRFAPANKAHSTANPDGINRKWRDL